MSTEIQAWLGARLPQDWFVEPATITVDRDEITVVGRLAAPDEASDAAEPERAAAYEGRIARFREQTREERIRSLARPSAGSSARSRGARPAATPTADSPRWRHP